MQTITVMGLGYIGLPTAITLSDAGFSVRGFDTNPALIDRLSAGQLHIVEPGLEEALLRALKSGRLTFSAEILPSDVYYISVPTPFHMEDGRPKAELCYVESAARMAAPLLCPGNLVILESTVPPGTTEWLSRLLAEYSDLSEADFYVAHCPERVIPGQMLHELKNNDRIVGGRSLRAGKLAAEIYEKALENGHVHLTDDLTAEMCKLTENTFRDINIAYANELSIICDRLGIDVFELIRLANCHPRVNILNPGVGVGGHCIAVDPWFIYEQFPAEARLIETARRRNDAKPLFVADCVERALREDKKKTIAVLGLSYKADVDDLRESPSLVLAHELSLRGYSVIGCEPYAPKGPVRGVDNHPSLEEALRLADFLVIATGHRQFIENLPSILQKPFYDCVGISHHA